MTKPEWGTKRTCQSCEARFYDMERSPVICPKCGEEQAEVVKIATKLKSEAVVEAAVKKPTLDDNGVDVDLDDLDVEDASEDEDGVIDDSSLLDDDDDDDDMSELMEHIEPKEKDD